MPDKHDNGTHVSFLHNIDDVSKEVTCKSNDDSILRSTSYAMDTNIAHRS